MIIKIIMRNLTMVGRVLKSIIFRPIFYLWQKFLSGTNLSRYISKVPKAAAKLPQAIKLRPEKRDDFYDFGDVYVAKKFFVIFIILLIGIPLLIIFVIWPFLVSLFFTAHLYFKEPTVNTYSGKVVLYYDEEKKSQMFQGRLKDGKYTDEGELFYEDGFVKYQGGFENSLYEGKGKLYEKNAELLYEGSFTKGLYDGRGILYEKNKQLYSGDFLQGDYHGKGILKLNDSEIYEGDFNKGVPEGKGTITKDGKVYYDGMFVGGDKSGVGTLFFEDGTIWLKGVFAAGLPEGDGIENYPDGNIKYKGNFSAGKYSGEGILFYEGKGNYYSGEFPDGEPGGKGELYINGNLYYKGDFAFGKPEGQGRLTDKSSGLTFSGSFSDGRIDYKKLFEDSVENMYSSFEEGIKDFYRTDSYWLYNVKYGIAIRVEFAEGENPPYISRIFDTFSHDDKDNSSKLVNGVLPAYAAYLFNVENEPGCSYIEVHGDGIIQHSWYGNTSDKFLFNEYIYQKDSSRGDALDEGKKPAGDEAKEDSKESEKKKYFSDLGLNESDFESLGLTFE